MKRIFILLLIGFIVLVSSNSHARYFNPETGRYLTPDPIGLEGGINLYVYSYNNPINYIDPYGLNVFQGILYGGKTGVTIGGPLGGAAGVIIGGAIGYFSGQWLSDVILNEITEDGEGCDNNRHSPDQQALNDLIDEQTLGGRRPLSEEDANTILDWGEELGIDGIRDDRGKDHWKGGNHIHVPGSGIGHIPTK